jgi:hypothetical protein
VPATRASRAGSPTHAAAVHSPRRPAAGGAAAGPDHGPIWERDPGVVGWLTLFSQPRTQTRLCLNRVPLFASQFCEPFPPAIPSNDSYLHHTVSPFSIIIFYSLAYRHLSLNTSATAPASSNTFYPELGSFEARVAAFRALSAPPPPPPAPRPDSSPLPFCTHRLDAKRGAQ